MWLKTLCGDFTEVNTASIKAGFKALEVSRLQLIDQYLKIGFVSSFLLILHKTLT